MRAALLVAGLVLALAACSGTEAATPTAPAAVPMDAPEPSPTPTLPPSPKELTVGATQTASDGTIDVKVTALRVRQPLRVLVDISDRKGYEYTGVEVKACVAKNESGEPVEVGAYPWTLSYADGSVVEASVWSAGVFDVTPYPDGRVVKVGRCVRGWITFETKKGTRPEYVTYGPSGYEPVEWAVK